MTDTAQDNTSSESQREQAAPSTGSGQAAGAYVPCSTAGSLQWYRSSGKPGELSWLADKFANSFAAAAGGLLRADLTVRLAAVAETTRRQFNQAVEEPTCVLGLLPLSTPSTGSGQAGSEQATSAADDSPSTSSGQAASGTCLEFSPALALVLIERLMGGRADLPDATEAPHGVESPGPAEHRPLTVAERRVLLHLANLVALSLSSARSALGALKPGAARGELRADLRTPAGAGDDRVLVATFELALGGRVGTMRLCGCGRLAPAGSAATTRRTAPAALEVTASIEAAELDADELAELADGDVIVTDLATDGEVVVRVGGIPKFAARLKLSDGRKILEITRRLGPAGLGPPGR